MTLDKLTRSLNLGGHIRIIICRGDTETTVHEGTYFGDLDWGLISGQDSDTPYWWHYDVMSVYSGGDGVLYIELYGEQ